MIINKSFYHDFELVSFELIKNALQEYKNSRMVFLLVDKDTNDQKHALTILKNAVKEAAIRTGHEEDTIDVRHIETGYSYPGETDIQVTTDDTNIDLIRYKKYAIVSGCTSLFSNDTICIITLIFSNGYYLGFNMKRKVTKWEDITSDTIKELPESEHLDIQIAVQDVVNVSQIST